ncbi:gag-protease polyprotein, partial [Trifolium medium]|nr:gag-protease polyprotein [Trifolium medium]
EDNLSEIIALIGRKFNKSLNKLQAKWRTNVPDKTSNIRSQSKVKDEDNSDQDKGVRCFECEGFGHIRSECPSYLKKQKRGMTTTLSDSNEENERKTANKAFTGKYETSSNTSDEDLLDEDVAEAHKHLGSEILDEILEAGKMSRDMKGLGFDNHVNKEVKIVPKKTIPPKKKIQEQMSNRMSQHLAQQKNQKSNNMSQHQVQHVSPQHKGYKEPIKRCDHCGRSGHMRSQCFKLHGYPQRPKSPRQSKKEIQAQKVWKSKDTQTKKVSKPKATTSNLMAHTPLKVSSKEDLYFDSGCS